MSQNIPFSTLKDFLLNGKGREQGTMLPPDADVDAIVTVLETGLEDKHIKAGGVGSASLADNAVTAAKIAAAAFRRLVFTGMGGSVTPGACTLTGAKIGDVVIGIVNLTDSTSGTANFESVITVNDQIQQTAHSNLSAKKFDAMLIAKG